MKMTDAQNFSIVIPTYNRPEQLVVCLQACARLDYHRDRFEVIVVDDGGATPLDEIVARFHGVLTLKLLRQHAIEERLRPQENFLLLQMTTALPRPTGCKPYQHNFSRHLIVPSVDKRSTRSRTIATPRRANS